MTKFYFFAFLLVLLSCRNAKNKPDVSDISVDLKVERFEKKFFNLDTVNITRGLGNLRNEFPHFYPVFFQGILQVNPMDTAALGIIRQILTSYDAVADSLLNKYNNIDWLKKELTEGFRFVKYYFPNYKVPNAITYIGTFDSPGIVLTPEYLGIGLHQFAGKNFSVYQTEAIQQLYPAYISRRFDREYISANAFKAVAEDVYPDQAAGRPLIEQMIEKGKQWYLVERFLPDAPDSAKTGFTQKQLDWVQENEGNVWAYIVKNENLYSIEPVVIQTYLGESPFTQGMPEASPGNIGQWIGWRIVETFAEENKEMTVQQVLQTEPKAILEGAKYKPK